jgi:hypothetical protein
VNAIPSRVNSTVLSKNLVTVPNPFGDQVILKLAVDKIRRAVKLLQAAILPGAGRTALQNHSSGAEVFIDGAGI